MEVKKHIADIKTHQLSAINPHQSLPFKIPTKFIKQHSKYRHTLYTILLQILYATVSLSLSWLAWYYLAAYPVYRVVALVVIVILWSNAASITARRKTMDMLETIEHPALKVWHQKKQKEQRKALYADNTSVYLKAIKTSFLKDMNEVR